MDDIPKEIKMITAILVGQKLTFPEGIENLPDHKNWWLMPPLKDQIFTVILSEDGENEFIVTSPMNVDLDYSLSDPCIDEDSQILVIVIKDELRREILMQSPLVINWDGPSKQIFTSDYEAFKAPNPGEKTRHLHIVK